jgi:hypothetical protein
MKIGRQRRDALARHAAALAHKEATQAALQKARSRYVAAKAPYRPEMGDEVERLVKVWKQAAELERIAYVELENAK